MVEDIDANIFKQRSLFELIMQQVSYRLRTQRSSGFLAEDAVVNGFPYQASTVFYMKPCAPDARMSDVKVFNEQRCQDMFFWY